LKRSRPSGRDQARRAAINALRRARRAALRHGVDLSAWEGEFLGSIEERLAKFGRAFADPEKGAVGQALSGRQHVKLKEISAKAGGKISTKARRRADDRRKAGDGLPED
jgi:hypothetical protein